MNNEITERPRVLLDAAFGATVSTVDDRAVVEVTGEVDLATADALWSAIETACAVAPRVLIDLTATTFMDSTGLTVLIRAHRHLGELPEALLVRAVAGSQVDKLFAISGVNRLLSVETVD